MRKQLKIGLFGFGVVGQGLYDILKNNSNFDIEIVRICVKHEHKRRTLPIDQFTFDKDDILSRDDLDIIVEAIDDDKAAFEIIKTALSKGIKVVTSNKKTVAKHIEELVALQMENRVGILYEASACSSIPIIRTLEEYFDNDLINEVSGIFNSSTNYILSKIFNKNLDYDIAVKQAQDLGYAESNPILDLMGLDALYKLSIVAFHTYGTFIDPTKVLHHGIHNISRYDIQYAREKGYKIKHIATVRKVAENKFTLFVLPQFISPESELYNVDYEYNGVVVDAAYCDKQFYYGKGAGGYPTGFAMMSDITASTYDYKYEFKKHQQQLGLEYEEDVILEVYLRYYDKKHLEHFQFEKINGEFKSKEYNYIEGEIKISSLTAAQEKLNTADVLLVHTGKIIKK